MPSHFGLSIFVFGWVMPSLLMLAGCGRTTIAQTKAGIADKTPGANQAFEVVLTGKPVRKTMTLTTTQPARTEALEQTPLHSKLAAHVHEVLVDLGDPVKKGQPLATLRAPEMDAELAQKVALLAEARAEVLQAEAGKLAADSAIGTAKSKVLQATAGLARAEADIARWQSENSRIKSLAASGSINRQLVDETEQKLSAAQSYGGETKAAVEAAKAAVAQAEAEAANAAIGITTAKSRVQVAEANIRYVEAMQSYLTIVAPYGGVVTERRIDQGHFVQPAGHGGPLLNIARNDKVRVFISVPESEAGYVDIDDPVQLEIPALRGPTLVGKITRTGYVIDATHRCLETVVDLDITNPRLRPGMFATATITLQEQKDVLALPVAAIVRSGKEAFCYRYLDGKAVKTPLRLGLKVADEFEIVAGLEPEETVILNKTTQMSDGQAVKVLPTAK